MFETKYPSWLEVEVNSQCNSYDKWECRVIHELWKAWLSQENIWGGQRKNKEEYCQEEPQLRKQLGYFPPRKGNRSGAACVKTFSSSTPYQVLNHKMWRERVQVKRYSNGYINNLQTENVLFSVLRRSLLHQVYLEMGGKSKLGALILK